MVETERDPVELQTIKELLSTTVYAIPLFPIKRCICVLLLATFSTKLLEAFLSHPPQSRVVPFAALLITRTKVLYEVLYPLLAISFRVFSQCNLCDFYLFLTLYSHPNGITRI